jgi:hypothetical protein
MKTMMGMCAQCNIAQLMAYEIGARGGGATGVENMMEMCGQCNFPWLMANVLDATTGTLPKQDFARLPNGGTHPQGSTLRGPLGSVPVSCLKVVGGNSKGSRHSQGPWPWAEFGALSYKDPHPVQGRTLEGLQSSEERWRVSLGSTFRVNSHWTKCGNSFQGTSFRVLSRWTNFRNTFYASTLRILGHLTNFGKTFFGSTLRVFGHKAECGKTF